MAPIKVTGCNFLPATIRVVACLNEKDLDYDFIPVDMFARHHKKHPYLSLNPFGQVPAFQDGDLKLFESRAINQYITHTYSDRGTPLIHDDPKEMAVARVWMDVEGHQYDPPAKILAWELAIKPFLGLTANDALVDAQEKKLAKVLDIYEARLDESKYLGGDSFTLADLNHLPTTKYLMETRVKALFDARPRVGAWFADISARPAWRKALAMYSFSIKTDSFSVFGSSKL